MSFADSLKNHVPAFNPVNLAEKTGIQEMILKGWLDGKSLPEDYAVFATVMKIWRPALWRSENLKERNQLLREAGLECYVFCDLLNKYRNGQSIASLAKACGLERQTLQRWCAAEQLPSQGKHDTLIRLANKLITSARKRHEFLWAAGHQEDTLLNACVVDKPIVHAAQFFGRKDELNLIIEQWQRKPPPNIAISGPKGCGKTSLLNQILARRDELPGKIILIDFSLPQMCSREYLLRHILEKLNLSIPSIDNCNFFSYIKILYDKLSCPAFIFMDNLDIGLQAPALDITFWDSMRALGQRQDNFGIGFLVTARSLPEYAAREQGMASPFF